MEGNELESRGNGLDCEKRIEELEAERDRIWEEFLALKNRFLAYVRSVAEDAKVSPDIMAGLSDFDGVWVMGDLERFLTWLRTTPDAVCDTLKSGLGADLIEVWAKVQDRDLKLQDEIDKLLHGDEAEEEIKV